MRNLPLLLAVLVLSVPTFAQSNANPLPDAPKPQVQAQTDLPNAPKPNLQPRPAGKVHGFLDSDKEYWTEAGALAVGWGLDTASTVHWIDKCKTCVEGGGLLDGSRSAPKIMAAWAAVDIGEAVLAYEWKHHVHNKWLHPLWRVPMIVRTINHTHAAISNWETTYK